MKYETTIHAKQSLKTEKCCSIFRL